MLYENNLIEKYNTLKDDLAELLLLREDIISIRDDLVTDDEVRLKVLYKKNLENLEESQLKLEIDIINLIRAGEIVKMLEFTNTFHNLSQVVDLIRKENSNSSRYNKGNSYFSRKLFEDVQVENYEKNEYLFKKIAKKISPSIYSDMSEEEMLLWNDTLKAKSNESEEELNNILEKVKEENRNNKFNIDDFCKSIDKIEQNLKVLDNEINEITKVCRENFDGAKLEKLNNLVKLVEIKNKSLRTSIKTLVSIRKNMLDGFLRLLPATKIIN